MGIYPSKSQASALPQTPDMSIGTVLVAGYVLKLGSKARSSLD
jgi:hypothetical protein